MIRPAALLLLAALLPAASGAVAWRQVLDQPATWYASAEARALAANLVQYQTPEGGWPKNRDMTQPPSAAQETKDTREPTIDNDATTSQLEYFARVITAGQDDPVLQAAFERGFDYLIAAQYANGGWPQYFPLRPGYYTHITFNDDAMINVLTLLRAVSLSHPPYGFVDAARRAKAAAAVEQGIACILRTQVKQNGKLTVWCAQHDEVTLAPAPARNFEPVSLSGAESVGIVRFLMAIENPTPEVVAAIEGAVAWLRTVSLHGLRVDNSPGTDGKKDRRAVADSAAPELWARFYELGTDKPIFTGRDKVIHYDFNEIERERRTGYNYLSNWPASLLAKDYPRWRVKHILP